MCSVVRLFLLPLIVLFLLGCFQDGQVFDLTGRAAPPLKLRTFVSHKLITLDSFKGKPVLVEFWATWCSTCTREMPGLAQLYDQLKQKGLVLIGVNQDAHPSTAIRYLHERGYRWLNLDDHTGKVSALWGADGIPVIALLNKEGEVILYRQGDAVGDETAIRAALHHIDPTKF